ncbi:MAG: hypothetical protein GEU71_04635 [Actinobacteria bacterium]|nr:hypothetical protein [Actinomycetota bacterium]
MAGKAGRGQDELLQFGASLIETGVLHRDDNLTVLRGLPSESVDLIYKFETAIRRAKHTTGYVIGFGFTKDAVEEVARVKEEGLDIRLVKVAEVLVGIRRPHGKQAYPQPATVEELPLPDLRKPKDLPSAEELIQSDKEAVGEGAGGAASRIAASAKPRGRGSVSRRDS